MAGPNEPNNETVRVDLPPPTPGKSPDPNIRSRETVRIQLPVREPMGKLPLHKPTELAPPAGSAAQDLPPSQFSEPVRPPSFSPPLSASVMPAPPYNVRERPSGKAEFDQWIFAASPPPLPWPLSSRRRSRTPSRLGRRRPKRCLLRCPRARAMR